jgi:hypothetical protein
MSDSTSTTDLLFAVREVGLSEPAWEAVDDRARSRLDREIVRARPGRTNARRRRSLPRRFRLVSRSRRLRGGLLVPVVALSMTAAAGAAVGVISLIQPAPLFRTSPSTLGTSPASIWRQTVVAGSVHELESLHLPGLGSIEYWTAATLQHGICGALRLPGGAWAGLPGGTSTAGGAQPGCRPTREQLDRGGRAALAADPFDYEQTDIRARDGRLWAVIYGVVSTDAGRPVIVRDILSGQSSPVVGGRYFALILPASPWNGEAPPFRLAAVDRADHVVVKEAPPPDISPPPAS